MQPTSPYSQNQEWSEAEAEKRNFHILDFWGENYCLILSLFCSNLLYSIYPSPKRTGQNTGVGRGYDWLRINRCQTEWSRVEFPVTFCASFISELWDVRRALTVTQSGTMKLLLGFLLYLFVGFSAAKPSNYSQCIEDASQTLYSFSTKYSFVKTLPRTSHAGPQCGDILRVRYPVPTPECTHEEILRWKVQMWLHYPGVSLQSIPLPRTGGQCSRNYEWSEVRKTWWWIWAEFSTLPENTSQRCSRRSHLHVRKGNF